MSPLETRRGDAQRENFRQVIALLDELVSIIGQENRSLLAGLPASLAQLVARKTHLAVELDRWLAAMRRGELGEPGDEPALLATLVERLRSLRALMEVNTALIRKAMRATRRRIDAIMQALRSTERVATGYGPDSMLSRRAPGARGTQWA